MENAKLYTMAEYYDVPHLKFAAEEKFKSQFSHLEADGLDEELIAYAFSSVPLRLKKRRRPHAVPSTEKVRVYNGIQMCLGRFVHQRISKCDQLQYDKLENMIGKIDGLALAALRVQQEAPVARPLGPE